MFAATASTTVPLAVPFWPDAIVTHDVLLVADQAHPLSVVTLTESRPPAAPMLFWALLRLNVHGAAAWLIVTRSEPALSAAVRADGIGFAATAYGTTASPWPVRLPENDTHDASELMDQLQSRVVEMLTEPLPPVGPNEDGELPIVNEHLSPLGAVTDVEVD